MQWVTLAPCAPMALASVSSDGRLLSADEFEKLLPDCLGTEEDEEYIRSLMAPVTEPGKFANWVAAPRAGIDDNPAGCEYVKMAPPYVRATR